MLAYKSNNYNQKTPTQQPTTTLTPRQPKDEKRTPLSGLRAPGLLSSAAAAFAIRTLATRSFFGRHSFMEDGLRDGISLGLELKDAN